MNIAICDDIKEYRLSIRAYAEAFFNNNNINYKVFEYKNGTELIII